MTDDLDRIQVAITDLVPKLLTAMEAFEQVQRNLHPQAVPELAEFVAPFEAELRLASDGFESLPFPDDLKHFQDMIQQGTTYALRAMDGLTHSNDDFGKVMKAMRAHVRAQEHIYPLAQFLSPVNKYFVEPGERDNQVLLQRISEGAVNAEPGKSGILSANNERAERGGFSVYIPEHVDPVSPAPVIMALHGGTGHGADFLWAWLRAARTRGMILVAPTSRQDTWSLMGEEQDLVPLLNMLKFVKDNWAVDDSRILLTGMSDGGTYSVMAACHDNSPFTHLAPFSGVLNPDLVMTGQIRHLAGKPVYLVHGSEDWMFPIETAYMAREQFTTAGANLTFREIQGLAHSFARTEIPALLDWFSGPA